MEEEKLSIRAQTISDIRIASSQAVNIEGDGISWEYGIVLNRPDDDASNEEIEKFSRSYKLLLMALVQHFGNNNVLSRPRGAIHRDKTFIKITADIERIEKLAEKKQMLLRLKDAHGGGWAPFSSKLKNKFRSPLCPKGIEEDFEDPNLFQPFQLQSLIEYQLNFALTSWAHSLMGIENEAVKSCTGANGIQWALSKKNKEISFIDDVFPLHYPGTARVRPSFLSRNELIAKYCGVKGALSTPFSFLNKSREFVTWMRSYFGEKVGLYFGFLHFYNMFLLIPAILGVITAVWQYIFESDNKAVPFYCLCVAFWALLFLLFWQRKQAAYAAHWNTSNFEMKEKELDSYSEDSHDLMYGFYEPRGSWVSLQDWRDEIIKEEPGLDPLIPQTMRLDPGGCPDCLFGFAADPREANTKCWRFFQSFFTTSVILIMVAAVSAVTISLLVFRLIIQEVNDTFGGIVAGAMNAVTIAILDWVYRFVATKLNDWEKHRTLTQYEDAIIIKTFFFSFINSYFSLFYIAFFKGINESKEFFGHEDTCKDGNGVEVDNCMSELSTQLSSMLITRMIIGNFAESLLPWLIVKVKMLWGDRSERKAIANEHPDWTERQVSVHLKKIGALRTKQGQVEKEHALPKYSGKTGNVYGVFDDYCELVIQFGFVTLFAPAFPLAAFVALLSNIIEHSSDSFKMLFSVSRAKYVPASDIGTWFECFRAVSIIGVLTNCLILSFTSNELNDVLDNPSPVYKLAIAVIIEHLIFIIQYLITYAVPPHPAWLRVENARTLAIQSIEIDFKDLQHLRTEESIIDECVDFDISMMEEDCVGIETIMVDDEEFDENGVPIENAEDVNVNENTKDDIPLEEKKEDEVVNLKPDEAQD